MVVAYGEAVEPALLSDEALYAETLALRRQLDRDALTDPLRLARHLDRQTVTRPHLRVASHAIAELEPGGGGRLLIVMPPQVGKTQLAAIWAPFWWLCRYPHLRGIIGCYASHLATKRGRSVRRLVQLYGARFDLYLDKGTQAANDWTLTSGGGIKSAGVGAGITGNPADLGIIDDPLKGRADADSPRIREKIWDWYSGDFYSRLAPGAPVVIMMTRWHEDDLIGRLISEEGTQETGGRWRIVYLPATARPADAKLGIPADALGRPAGAPLTHPRIASRDVDRLARHWADKRASSTPRDWGALYMGDPRPTEGALVSRELLRQRRCYHPDATPVKHAVAVDPSGGGRSTAGIIGGWLGDDGRLYLTHDRSAVMNSEQWAEATCLLAAETNADSIFVEANYGGDMYRVIAYAWSALRRRADAYAAAHPVDGGLFAAAVAVLGGGGPRPALAAELNRQAVACALLVANEPAPGDYHSPQAAGPAVLRARERARQALARLLRAALPAGPRCPAAGFAGALAVARYAGLAPRVEPVYARKGKVLRAEPVAQQLTLDRMRLAAPLPELEDEWATWQPASPESPGRIDGSVHLALQLLPIPNTHQLVSTHTGVRRADVAAAASQGMGPSGMPVLPRTQGQRPVGGGSPHRPLPPDGW